MRAPEEIVFVRDRDNTRFDNNHIDADLKNHLTRVWNEQREQEHR
jgi:hypothetical protein